MRERSMSQGFNSCSNNYELISILYNTKGVEDTSK